MSFRHVDPHSANAVASSVSRVPSGVGALATAAELSVACGAAVAVLAMVSALASSDESAAGMSALPEQAIATIAAAASAKKKAVVNREAREYGAA